MYEPLRTSPDTVDVAEVVRTLRRQWRAVMGFLALGVLGALAVILFAPRRFDGRVTVLARAGNMGGTSIGGRMTGIGDLLGGLGSLTGAGGLETELQMLRSRAIAGQVVDSLQLQVRVRDPGGLPPSRLIEHSVLGGSFAPRTLRFERIGNGAYRAHSKGTSVEFIPGQPKQLDIGTITLRAGDLPAAFKITIFDREDAIQRFSKRLEATKAGGDIAKVIYRGDDSVTAAVAPNAVVAFYLQRRKTIDRGVNQRRVEYVAAQVDSTAAALAATERLLRQYQEASRVIDPVEQGKVELEGAAQLRALLTDVQVDEGTIKQLLAQADDGRITSRDLAAYPGFLKGTTVAPLISQLSELEASRIRLLERRTEKDPEVVAVDKTMRAVEANIVATARSYASSISRQRGELQGRLDSLQRSILAIPAAAERGGRLQRDVIRLTQIYTALQAQLVEARLGAIGEGGELRQIDYAVMPRQPSFPKPFLTMGIGTAGGLLCGMIAALFLGWFGRWLRDPMEIERAVGVLAQRFEPNVPLMMAAGAGARTVLVVPLDARAQLGNVAERLARTARQRSLQATVVDLTSSHASGNGKAVADVMDVRSMIDRLEQENGVVIVQLPGLASEATVAAMSETRPVLFVAPPGPVDRVRLASAVETLRRLQVPCAGVVISDGGTRALT